MARYEITAGTPHQMGARHDGNGVNFTVFSAHASRIDLCLFSADALTEIAQLTLPEKTGPIWHGYVSGLPVGTLYGFRAHGSYAPEQGHRFNAHKLLLDPYTREFHGTWQDLDKTLGYEKNSPHQDLSFDTQDSAPFVPKSVVSPPDLLSPQGVLGDDPTSELIYEAHVKGLTQTHSGVPQHLRGTYEGLASDAMIEHLQGLGITTVELLPVHAFVDDQFLRAQGLRNYWGYNSISFFAPEPRYFGPAGLLGFRTMVERLKAAGISVILDVVYNHTAECDHRGPTLCYRGLDNASYYRLIAGQPRYYVNDTGCGNTLNVSHPYVLRMVMDSLRFWVKNMGVDGFRFDLATTVGREDHGFDPNGGFFDAVGQDPDLSGVKLIAEPWDLGPGGYRLGEFPHAFSEWNDKYRDTVRRYWRGDPHSAQELGARLLGSAERFDRAGRRAGSSVNFLSSHDGFTLADVTRFNHRHNEANNENNQDGHNANYTDNCGVEGDTDDPEIREQRARRQRNMLATLFVSQGTPMVLAGDEISNSQNGNNNAYCQDNSIGWVNWDGVDTALMDFVKKLSEFRALHKALRQSRFLHGENRPADGVRDVEWTDFSGQRLQWRDPGLSCLSVTLRISATAPPYEDDGDMVFVVFNRDNAAATATLPPAPKGKNWQRCIDTANPELDPSGPLIGATVTTQGQSVVVLGLTKAASQQ